MVKTGKKILVITLWVLIILLVGCLVFTGTRLAKSPKDLGCYQGERFEGKNITLTFTDTGAWYDVGENEVILLEITDYKDGVITMTKGETEYVFVAIDGDTLYDESEKELLNRRKYG